MHCQAGPASGGSQGAVVSRRGLRPLLNHRVGQGAGVSLVEERPEGASRNQAAGDAGFETSAARTPQPAMAADDEPLSWQCPGCSYTYDVVAGEEREGFAAGTAWSEIPDGWCCPDCGVREKVDFVPVETVAA